MITQKEARSFNAVYRWSWRFSAIYFIIAVIGIAREIYIPLLAAAISLLVLVAVNIYGIRTGLIIGPGKRQKHVAELPNCKKKM